MADELSDIATRIRKQREQSSPSITLRDLDILADKIKEAGSKERIDPEELARIIARSTAASLTSKLPSIQDIIGTFIRANPVTAIAANLIGKAFGGVGNLLDSSKKDRSKEAEALLKEIERMRKEMLGSSEDNTQATEKMNEVFGFHEEVLKDILKETQGIHSFLTGKDKEQDLLRLQNLDTDTPVNQAKPDDKTNKLLGQMLALQERSFIAQMMGNVKGLFTGIVSGISGALGGLLGGGLGAMAGRLATGAKFLGKLTGVIGLVVGAAMEFYEGWNGAAKFFGDENVSFMGKLRYALIHLVSSILAPFDWAVSYFTGEESNIRGKFERWSVDFQDTILGYLSPITDTVVSALSWVGDTLSELMSGITMDTKIVEIPSIFYENLSNMFMDVWNRISFKQMGDDILESINSGKQLATSLANTIIDSTVTWFRETYNNILDWASESIREKMPFGSFLANKAQELKAEGVGNSAQNIQPEGPSAWERAKEFASGSGYKAASDSMGSDIAERAQQANAESARRAEARVADSKTQQEIAELRARLAASAPTQSKQPIVAQSNVTSHTTVTSTRMDVDPPGFGGPRLVPSY